MTAASRTPEAHRAYQAKWNAAHPERRAGTQRRYDAKYRADPARREKMRLYRTTYRARHPDRVRAQQAADNRKHRARKADAWARYHARKMSTQVQPIERLVIYERDGGRCHICTKHVPRKSFEVDHLIPLSRGGEHTPANVAVAHRRCNASRGAGRLPAQLRLVG